MKMTQQGAKLQRLNNDLVKVIETLKQQREEVMERMEALHKEKKELEREMQALHERLTSVNQKISNVAPVLNTYTEAIRDAESSYYKICQGSEMLLNILKKDLDAYRQIALDTSPYAVPSTDAKPTNI
ncbi:unnamed protein product [Darwinula stevensoni]|uniref:Uncharacterized protein n=1 Tax=Darwinula stevensoni TaxID=69355 RepID=A0A7R8XGC4_9CRUS|nr:unnamed protein product [Darwinula stevensoni]CAG0891359.1 unnamed protein product [Darwinula stevensoni]